jgi:tripartite-type tricarboxylate transporter receptor subunit TctC
MSARRLVSGLLLGLACAALSGADVIAEGAADWPNKTVRVIVNYGPGGTADNSMRPFAQRLSTKLGHQFVIENRGGASGALGVEVAMKSASDGYTFLVTPAPTMCILPHLRKTPFDPLKDLTPVSQITDGVQLLAVHPSIPTNNMAEFVDYLKKNPAKLSWGSAGVGTFGHIMGEIFKIEAGVDFLHVPYRGGGESLADFLAGVVQIHADPNTLSHVSSGKAKLFAVLDRARLPDFPDVPTLKEIYPSMDFLAWYAVYAPVGTPEPIIRKFSEELNKVAREPDMKLHLSKVALSPYAGTPEELAALTQKDYERFGAIIRKLNIKAE